MQDRLPNFSWLIPGALAGMGRPRAADDLAALHAGGIRAVLTLTEEPLPPAWLAAHGLRAVHLPVPDFTAPSPAQIVAAVGTIDDFRASGIPTVVHCAAGRGRTGTILACILVAGGMSAAEAVTVVRTARPGSIETKEQVAAVAAYAAMLRGENDAP